MALAFAEGECFFNKIGLKHPNTNLYQADSPWHFYRTLLVEYIWNKPSHKNSGTYAHPRSGYAKCGPYSNYTRLPFSYGPNRNDIRRRVDHNLCISESRFKKVDKGAALESWFMPMPMPTAEERCVFIDTLACIRAIYIPLAHSSSEDYPGLCTFVQINFAHNANIHVWNGSSFDSVGCSVELGLGMNGGRVIGFDIYGLINLLSLPRQMRKESAYTSKLVTRFYYDQMKTVATTSTWWDERDFDWTKVAQANFGLSVQWKPPNPTSTPWYLNFLKNITTIAIGFVPVIGPLLAVETALLWTAVVDPDNFLQELRNQIPVLELGEHFEEFSKMVLLNSAEQRKYLLPGWADYGKQFAAASRAVVVKSENVASFAVMTSSEDGLPIDVGPNEQFVSAGRFLAATAGQVVDESLNACSVMAEAPSDAVEFVSSSDTSNNDLDEDRARLGQDLREEPVDWVAGYLSICT